MSLYIGCTSVELCTDLHLYIFKQVISNLLKLSNISTISNFSGNVTFE